MLRTRIYESDTGTYFVGDSFDVVLDIATHHSCSSSFIIFMALWWRWVRLSVDMDPDK